MATKSRKAAQTRLPASKRNPRKALKKSQRAGGAAGDALRARLGRLIRAEGLSQRQFALKGGLASTTSRVTDWLVGRTLPNAERLMTIANAFRVSLDWLMLGDGGEGPIYRAQSRPPAELAADVAAYVARELTETSELLQFGMLLDGNALLQETTRLARDELARLQSLHNTRNAIDNIAGNLLLVSQAAQRGQLGGPEPSRWVFEQTTGALSALTHDVEWPDAISLRFFVPDWKRAWENFMANEDEFRRSGEWLEYVETQASLAEFSRSTHASVDAQEPREPIHLNGSQWTIPRKWEPRPMKRRIESRHEADSSESGG